MTFIPKVEAWLEDARRRRDAAREGGELRKIEQSNVEHLEVLLAELRGKSHQPMREPGEDDD